MAMTLFTHRLHVLRDYRLQVLEPTLSDLVRRQGPAVLTREASLLIRRHPKLLTDAGRRQVGAVLERHERLRTVLEFRDSLQSIWDETNAAQENALARWGQFCEQAGRSNIEALRAFVSRLHMYRIS
jgi:hypothetical protein